MFSLEFRATASEGVMLFAGDAETGDHIGLYMKDGHVVFSFNSGSGTLRLASERRYVDGEWHSVAAAKNRKEGSLRVDDVEVGRGSAPGTNFAADTKPPFFVGGVQPSQQHFAAKVRQKLVEVWTFLRADRVGQAMEGVKSAFGGCLRALALNQLPFGTPDRTPDSPVPCATFTEPGLFFGPGPARAVLQESFTVCSSIFPHHYLDDSFDYVRNKLFRWEARSARSWS